MAPSSWFNSQRRSAFLFAGFVLIMTCASQAKDSDGRVAREFQRLKGRWKVITAEVGGDRIASEEEWQFSSAGYSWRNAKRELRGEPSLNLTWNPPQICFRHTFSSESGRLESHTSQWDCGIYKLSEDGNSLTVCLRPLPMKEFKTLKDDKRRLYVFKRIKEEAPAEKSSTPSPR